MTTSPEQTIAIDIREAVKVFGSGSHAVKALNNVSLQVADNEFFTLLGPSGCGKTTLLRLIAGFESVSSGSIHLFGEEIEDLPPNRRPVNTVFQQYTLFPHMNVFENVAFGLRRLGKGQAEISSRVDEMLALVRLANYANRHPSQLSGGQQQRVALARALAPSPKVLLLDEPLSALDLKLRQAMRLELKQIQRNTGITFVFVTHDQEEALTMSDFIAVMSAGQVQQIGAAKDIYEAPNNRFVADFIGETNLLEAEILGINGTLAYCRIAGGASLQCRVNGNAGSISRGHISIRPERLSFTSENDNDEAIKCVVTDLVYLGTDTHYVVEIDDGSQLTVRVQNAHEAAVPFVPGDKAALRVDDGAARLLVD